MLVPSSKRRLAPLGTSRDIHMIMFFGRQIDVQFLRPKDGKVGRI
jgi:hypothetical protein